MPLKPGPIKEKRINYRIPPDLVSHLENEMQIKNYSDQTEMITVILRDYFKNKNIEDLIDLRLRIFLKSEEGKKLIKDI